MDLNTPSLTKILSPTYAETHPGAVYTAQEVTSPNTTCQVAIHPNYVHDKRDEADIALVSLVREALPTGRSKWIGTSGSSGGK